MAVALDQTLTTDQPIAEDRRPGLPFLFTGKAGEYFGIWIVNLLLSIVTLGIYSAWAKVRTKRYFYGNTKLDGSSFDYLASPVQILIGRLIIFAVLIPIGVLAAISPLASVLYIPLYLAMPWFIVKALKFNARNSSYRNVRFNFVGGVGPSYITYLLLPLGALLSLGLLLPYTAFAAKRFQIDNARFGQRLFAFDGHPSRYYWYWGAAVLLGLVGFAVFFVLILLFAAILSAMGNNSVSIGSDPFGAGFADTATFFPIVLVFVLGFIVQSYLAVRLQNYAFNSTRISDHQFRLDLELLPFIWIRFSNLLAIVLSVGLLIPWARIRMARYQIERMSLVPHGDLETLVDEEQKHIRALGEEFGEGMDVDLGLGV